MSAVEKSYKTRGRVMVFLGAHVHPETREEIVAWARAEDRTISNLVTRLIRLDLIKSGYYPSDESENEPQRKVWPEISLAPPVRMTML